MLEIALGVGAIIVLLAITFTITEGRKRREKIYADVAEGLKGKDRTYFVKHKDEFYKLADLAAAKTEERKYESDITYMQKIIRTLSAFEPVKEAWLEEQDAQKAALKNPEAYEGMMAAAKALSERTAEITAKGKQIRKKRHRAQTQG